MSNCIGNNVTPQPCCQDCPQTDPCLTGCLDIIGSECLEHLNALNCLGLPANAKLNVIIDTIDAKFCEAASNGDKFVKVTALDPIAGYLFNKVKTCDYISKTTVNEAGQQKLNLCLDLDNMISDAENNPVFFDVDGISINYTTLVNTIVNTPALLQALCDAITDCTPS